MTSTKYKNKALEHNQINKIKVLIRSWNHKLTWEKLIASINTDLGIEISRQALSSYDGIKKEYKNRKNVLRGAPLNLTSSASKSEVDLQKRIERLEAEIEVKNESIEKQLAMIKDMLANAQEIPNYNINDLVRPRND